MENTKKEKQAFMHEAGVTYFSKKTERRICFLLTMAMLTWGVIDYATNLF
jgi:hypothetical protein